MQEQQEAQLHILRTRLPSVCYICSLLNKPNISLYCVSNNRMPWQNCMCGSLEFNLQSLARSQSLTISLAEQGMGTIAIAMKRSSGLLVP